MSDEINELRARIENLEKALLAYHSLTMDLLPPAAAENVNNMFDQFFYASESYGDHFKKGVQFKNKTPGPLA